MRVLIFAWGGARRHQLEPLVSFYQAAGLDVMLMMPDATAMMFLPLRWARDVRELVERVRAHQTEPWLLHAFSNTGFLCYRAFVEAAEAEGVKLSFRARIFDSGPGLGAAGRRDAFVDLWTRALIPMFKLGDGDPDAAASPLKVFGLKTFWGACFCLYQQRIREIAASHDWFIARERNTTPAPIFLYSLEDQVIPPHHITETIAELRHHRVKVVESAWDGVGHVQHLRYAPERHLERIRATLGDVGVEL